MVKVSISDDLDGYSTELGKGRPEEDGRRSTKLEKGSKLRFTKKTFIHKYTEQ